MLPLFSNNGDGVSQRHSLLGSASYGRGFQGQPHKTRRSVRQLLRTLVLVCAALTAYVLVLQAYRWGSTAGYAPSLYGVSITHDGHVTPRTPNSHPAWTAGDLRHAHIQVGSTGGVRGTRSSSAGSVSTASKTVNRKLSSQLPPLPGAKLRHLILVAGHAVYVGRDYSEASKETSWFLEDYQQVEGEAASFVEHIQLGVQEAARDPDAMLLFSGGQTRLAAGPRSEGLSYWVVAEAAGWFNVSGAPGVRARTFTEEHARDSFENLLFSLCRFFELSGHYPDQVTVVSYTLKQARFTELHRAALRFPAPRFRFIGNAVPPAATGAQEGEARTVAAFCQDPYGCADNGELLLKKLRRDPFAVGPPHPSRCPALQGLLGHCSTTVYDGPLPWDTLVI